MYEYRILEKNEYHKWFNFAALIYGDNNLEKTKAIFNETKLHWDNLINKNHAVVYAVFDNEKIISVLHLFYRDAYYLNKTIKIGCIGSVATHINYRKQGLASKLLDMAIKTMEEKNMMFPCSAHLQMCEMHIKIKDGNVQ